MMNKQQTFLTIAILAFLLASAFTPGEAQPSFPPLPSSFYGTLQVNGEDVQAGTHLSAWIDGVQYAEVSSTEYGGNSVYVITVPGDDASTPGLKEGGVEGETIEFHIENLVAAQTGPWHSGTNVELNLTASGVFLDQHVYIPAIAYQYTY